MFKSTITPPKSLSFTFPILLLTNFLIWIIYCHPRSDFHDEAIMKINRVHAYKAVRMLLPHSMYSQLSTADISRINKSIRYYLDCSKCKVLVFPFPISVHLLYLRIVLLSSHLTGIKQGSKNYETKLISVTSLISFSFRWKWKYCN